MDVPIEGFYLANRTTPLIQAKLHFKGKDKWMYRVGIENHIHLKYVTLVSREDGLTEPITALCFWSNVDEITFPIGVEIQVPYSSHWWTYIYYVKSPKSIPGYKLLLRGFLLQHSPFTYNSQITLPKSKIAFQHKFNSEEKHHYLQPLIIGKVDKTPTKITILATFREKDKLHLTIGKETLVSTSSYDRICFVEKLKLDIQSDTNGNSTIPTNNLDKAICDSASFSSIGSKINNIDIDCQSIPPFVSPKTLFEDIIKILTQPGDINLLSTDGKLISCHSFLLRCRSVVLQKLLEDEAIIQSRMISLRKYKTDVLLDFVHFLATDVVLNIKDHAIELLELAHEFSVDKLGLVCLQHIRQNKGDYDFFRLMEVAGKIRCDKLAKDLISN